MEEREVDVREYIMESLRIFRKKWKFIVIFTIAFGIAAFIYTRRLKGYYESYALVKMPFSERISTDNPEKLNVLLKNPFNPYLNDIAESMNLKLEQAYGLSRMFTIDQKSDFLEVVGKNNTPEGAKKLADLICQILVRRGEEQKNLAISIIKNEMKIVDEQIILIRGEINNINKKIKNKENTSSLAQSNIYQSLYTSKIDYIENLRKLKEKYDHLNAELEYSIQSVSVVAEPSLPGLKIEPRIKNMISLWIGAGLVIAFILSLILAYFEEQA